MKVNAQLTRYLPGLMLTLVATLVFYLWLMLHQFSSYLQFSGTLRWLCWRFPSSSYSNRYTWAASWCLCRQNLLSYPSRSHPWSNSSDISHGRHGCSQTRLRSQIWPDSQRMDRISHYSKTTCLLSDLTQQRYESISSTQGTWIQLHWRVIDWYSPPYLSTLPRRLFARSSKGQPPPFYPRILQRWFSSQPWT